MGSDGSAFIVGAVIVGLLTVIWVDLGNCFARIEKKLDRLRDK